MANYAWPPADKRVLIGSRVERVDGPQKTTGVAKYAFDINRPGMLWAKVVGSTHAHAKVTSVDTAAAEALPGVKAVWKDETVIGGATEVQYVGQIIAAVAAESEEIARDAAALVKVQYEVLPHQVMDSAPELSTAAPSNRTTGDVDDAIQKADKVVEGDYGISAITHCCLESHGQTCEYRDGEMYYWPSTQGVSGYADAQLGRALGLPVNKIHVDCQYMGGGFGSKLSGPDKWGAIGGLLSKQTGKPVKLMLERDEELMIAGNRPSGFAKIKVGAQKDGTVTAFDATVWGTSGIGGAIPNAIPYVFSGIPNTRVVGKRIQTNRGSARAWRAPNHPQQCLLTMSALADVAAALQMDELEFFRKNLPLTDRAKVYDEELTIAADIIGYKSKAHLRGDKTPGHIKRGLGVSMHTWGGRGHASECDVKINADGSVEANIGSQDLGTGTRTAIDLIIADTLGLPLDAVKVNLGSNAYPKDGGSGGSSTIGGVSTSSRKGATAALNSLFAVAAPKLGTTAENLEAVGGQVRQIDKPSNKMAWKDACALLELHPITERGANVPNESVAEHMISQGVGGVQIADVSVDMETGIVTMNEFVAVQDVGLVVNMKLAESQVFGAMIMGVSYALFEEMVYDAKTGRMLNPDMEFYRLAGLKDVGMLKVHMMTGPGYDDRGVIGIGEPPVVSPGAAISNAVANACGVRVPHLPLTPDRVIAALQKGGLLS